MNQVNDLKHQIKKLEETNGDLSLGQKQLKREIHESLDQLDNSHKECGELKRLLKDVELEKETALNNANDLTEIIKSSEGIYWRKKIFPNYFSSEHDSKYILKKRLLNVVMIQMFEFTNMELHFHHNSHVYT